MASLLSELDIKDSKFRMNPTGLDYIRWGLILVKDKPKVLAFKIDIIHHAFKTKEEVVAESDKVIKQIEEKAENNEPQLFEWMEDIGFEEVNPKEQNWFKL